MTDIKEFYNSNEIPHLLFGKLKYPRLPETLDRRKKLMEEDKASIRLAYKQAEPFPTRKELHQARKFFGIILQSKSDWRKERAEMYGVDVTTIRIWTDEQQRQKVLIRSRKILQQKYKNMTEAEKKTLYKKQYQFRTKCEDRYPAQREYKRIKNLKRYHLSKKI